MSCFIKSITIPSSVEIIGDFAFYYCLNLNKVTLNSGLKSINRSAFYMCGTLDEIFIPKTIEAKPIRKIPSAIAKKKSYQNYTQRDYDDYNEFYDE